MRVALIGYGSMGHEIEKVLLARGHEISARIDPVASEADAPALSQDTAASSDMAIEFTVPAATVGNVRDCARLGLSVVVGTTGWYDRFPEVRQAVSDASTGLLYGANFSVGAHVFFSLVADAARLVKDLPDYDVACTEIHHRRKKDSPSGTALRMARIILANCPRKSALVTERLDRAPEPHELHVSSTRAGNHPGRHTLFIDSAADTIEISHSARSRAGFALGAVMGAEWLQGRPGIHEVDEFMAELLGSGHGKD